MTGDAVAASIAHEVKQPLTAMITSADAGFRFLDRLVNEYKNGTNNFNKPSEALYGVYTHEGILIGIGGLNIDPYTKGQKVGRVRRFYISKKIRK